MPSKSVRLSVARILTLTAAALVPAGTSRSQPANRPAPAAAAATSPATRPAPATHPAELDAEIDALLTQLASDDWPARTAAQNRLAGLAELAEPRLARAARESDDPEVRTRCEAALRQIADERVVGPTLVTMRVHQVHPRVAFDELARQAGAELKPQAPSLWNQQLPPVSLDVRREPFWLVAARIREQCGLDLDQWQFGLTVMQTAPGAGGGGGNAPTVTHGPFRVRATRVSRSSSVDLTSGAAAMDEFGVTLAFHAEPKLKVSAGSPYVTLERAEDENGLSLLPDANAEVDAGGPAAAAAAAAANAAGLAERLAVERAAAIAAGRGLPRGVVGDVSTRAASGWGAQARLAYPAAGAGKRIAILKGTATCSVVVRVEMLDVPDVLTVNNVTREVAGTTVTIRSCRKVGAQYELVVGIPRTDANAMTVMRMLRGPGQSQLRLVDADGRNLTAQGASTSTTDERIEMTFRYGAAGPAAAAAGAPTKLLWQVPAETREVQVPFTFTDLPLP